MTTQKPDPIQLTVLVQLRNAANLTQSKAAVRCGLSSKTSRKTFAAWEKGRSTPPQSRQPIFLLYLLRDCGLLAEPERFEEVYTLLLEQWEWLPLSEEELEAIAIHAAAEEDPLALFMDGLDWDVVDEWDDSDDEELAGPVDAEDGSSPESDSPEADALTADLAVDEPNARQAAKPLPNTPSSGWRRLQFSPLTNSVLLAALFFALFVGLQSCFPPEIGPISLPATLLPEEMQPPVAAVSTPAPTQMPQQFGNGSFEQGLTRWQPVSKGDQGCQIEIVAEGEGEEGAKDGSYFLRVLNDDADCISLRQDIDLAATGTMLDEVAVAVRVRSPAETPLNADLLLWALPEPTSADQGASAVRSPDIRSPDTEDVDREASDVEARASERARATIQSTGDGWRCYEVRGSLDPETDKMLRIEISFEDPMTVTALNGGDATPAAENAETDTVASSGGAPGTGIYDLDHVQIGFGAGRLCPPQPPTIANGSFEQDPVPVQGASHAWSSERDLCNLDVMTDPDIAFDGNSYLSAQKVPNCFSIYVDEATYLAPGQKVTARLWARSPRPQANQPRLALWALRDELPSVSESVLVSTYPDEWICAEVSLEMPEGEETTTLRTEIYLDSEEATYFFDDVSLEMGETLRCPERPVGLVNAGFEMSGEGEGIPGWQTTGQACDAAVLTDQALARSGEGVAAISRGQDFCTSLLQDVAVVTEPGDELMSVIYVRSAEEEPQPPLGITSAIWASGSGDGVENGRSQMTVQGEEWICVETRLPIENAGQQAARMEIYLDTPGDGQYFFDDAAFYVLREGSQNRPDGCPQVSLGLENHQISPMVTTFYPGGTVPVAAEIFYKNDSENASSLGSSNSQAGGLQTWISDTADGNPLDGNLTGFTPFADLAPNQSAVLYADASIPLGLPPGDYYVVWDLRLPGGLADDRLDDNRKSRLIQVAECVPGAAFCDVPPTYWAYDEIMTWFELGITSGCRSGTEPYQDRPFCPEMLVARSTIPVFFLRHLFGSDYTPTGNYEGIYADLPMDFAHNRAYWVEALQRQGIELTSERCAADGADQPLFCPTLYVTRAELIAYLSQLEEWPLSPVTGDLFLDVQEDTPTNRAIEYAAQTGLLAQIDPHCPPLSTGQRFCPDDPARRAFASLVMVRSLEE